MTLKLHLKHIEQTKSKIYQNLEKRHSLPTQSIIPSNAELDSIDDVLDLSVTLQVKNAVITAHQIDNHTHYEKEDEIETRTFIDVSPPYTE